MNAALLLATILVLNSGDRIDVAGDVRFEGPNAVFRVPGGALYSLPVTEINLVATEAIREKVATTADAPRKLKLPPEERKRLLEELAANRGGKPAAYQPVLDDPLPKKDPQREESRAQQQQQDEWQWRREAREYDDRVTQARENLQLLIDRIDQLQGEITSFLALGYETEQFTYQTTQLHRTREQIPAAQLEVRRAERAREQFRDDARKQGIAPGWLR